MKRKAVLTLAMAAVLVAMLAAPAFAATVQLPIIPNWVNNDNQKGWRTDGTDDIATDLTLAQLQAAKYLVLEVPSKPEGSGIQFTFQCDPDWGWTQTDLQVDDIWQDGKLVFEFSKMSKIADLGKAESNGKILVAYYDGGWDALGVTKAYLTDSLGGGGGGGGSAKTGDSTMIVLAIAAFALAACATVFVARKVKA